MMTYMLNHPRVLTLFCVLTMWVVARAGSWMRDRSRVPDEEIKDNLTLVVSATLTLLGLIIGFTFSMATTRYDQRRLFEEQEANAIGTEYVRADLLGVAAAANVKAALRDYLDTRIAFYHAGYGGELTLADQRTSAEQRRLWAAIKAPASAQPNPVMALVVSGMNDVLNSQGYTQFAWWNRIPKSAWVLMIVIALFSNGLVGYATHRSRFHAVLLCVLPLIVSVSFFLVADIDSPRGGMIRIPPRDLLSLKQSIGTTQPR